MSRIYRPPFSKWVDKMRQRIMRLEWRAKLDEARANARKWNKEQTPRQGRSRRRRRRAKS